MFEYSMIAILKNPRWLLEVFPQRYAVTTYCTTHSNTMEWDRNM